MYRNYVHELGCPAPHDLPVDGLQGRVEQRPFVKSQHLLKNCTLADGSINWPSFCSFARSDLYDNACAFIQQPYQRIVDPINLGAKHSQ